MPETETALIARCAAVADDAAAELEAILQSGRLRKTQYDRQSANKLRYAIRWCRRIAERIRGTAAQALTETAIEPDAARLSAALAALRELRPVIASSRDSNWKLRWLRRIDELINQKKSS